MSRQVDHDKESTTNASDSKHAEVDLDVIEAHAGVKTVEATHKVYGKYSKWALFIGLALAAYIYSLEGQTTYTYLAFAASDLQNHSLLAAIGVAQAVIIAVGKPVVAKLADITSRATAYIIVLLFYVVGYIVVASAKSIEAVGGGTVVYAVGYTGLQLLTQVIIADITTLKWRGLVSSLISTPFIINAFVGSKISASIVTHSGWRWGYGMFVILVPAALSPLIVTLLWAERKAKRLGLVPQKPRNDLPFGQRVIKFLSELNIIGLLLLGASVALILLPITLVNKAQSQWRNASMIAMVVVGAVLLLVFAIWDFKFAKHPVIPMRFVKNRSIVLASLIGFFDFISFYLTFTYLFSFIVIVKPWKLVNVNYFVSTQVVALTFFGILAGLALRFLKQYKVLLIIGLCIRLLGVGLMIHSRGANASDAEVVWTQILQGLGGGIASVCTQVAAQASVPHIDVAMATAVVLLITEIGGAIGNAIAGSIWTHDMPAKLAQYLPTLPQAQRDQLFASMVSVSQFPRGNPIREGAILAYSDVMHKMLITATCMAVPPIIFSLLMPNWYLGDKQNAVVDEDLAGNVGSESEKKRPIV